MSICAIIIILVSIIAFASPTLPFRLHVRTRICYTVSTMEFEADKTTPTNGISDAERLAASTRRLELTPVHADISPDSLPDEVVATQHIVQGALGNIPTESEATTTQQPIQQQQPTATPKHRHLALATGVAATLAIASLTAVFYLA